MQNKNLIHMKLISNKNYQQTRNRMKLPSLDKSCLQKPTANITLNDENLKAFSLRSGIKQYTQYRHFYCTGNNSQ